VGTTATRVGNGGSVGIYGGNGNDVIYLGNGGGTVDGGGGTNICHLPSLSKVKYSIYNCTKVSP
jgi:Ca2+-binding RTX toxin-like protein